MDDPNRKRSFDEVLAAELDAIRVSREHRLGREQPALSGSDPTKRAHDAQLLGLAFSGGGIRSATFNLGVLQTLARKRLLRRFDYLSTVSGGGYIGSWLHAWTAREDDIAAVEEKLAGAEEPEAAPIGFLRRFSNYLTPRLGLFSADTWSAVAAYLRNLTLTLAGLFPILGLIVLGPYLIAVLSGELLEPGSLTVWMGSFLFGSLLIGVLAKLRVPRGWRLVAAGAALIAWGGLMLALRIRLPASWLPGGLALALFFLAWGHIGTGSLPKDRFRVQGSIQRNVVVPSLLAAWLGSCVIWSWCARGHPAVWVWVLVSAGVYGAAVVCARIASRGREDHGLTTSGAGLAMAGIAGLAAGLPLWGLAKLFHSWGGGEEGLLRTVAWGGPLLTQVFAFAVVIHIGLMGRKLSKASLEWWSRLGAWLFVYNLGWAGLLTVVLKGPKLLDHLEQSSLLATHSSWLLPTIAGVWAGRSARTGGPKTARLLKLLVTVAPYLFIVAVLALLSRGLSNLIDTLGAWAVLYVPLSLGVLTYLVWRLDINRFSMHLFYRNRLVRAYLGASRRARAADPFTGFSPQDDEPLAGLNIERGPYPIVNTALNLVAGSDLAWQERKAAAFSFTPLYCGYQFPNGAGGYRPSRSYGAGVSLGTAMAISGAAASPNMGYHSSPSLALLMTIFNVRLGWWAANTTESAPWTSPGPHCGLCYLIKETLGLTAADTDYVYLSDGGHFENLGAYELVRRRCRLIVVSDAGQDAGMAFDDLGNLIRKCRIDLGIDIEIGVDAIRHGGDGRSKWHCAVGSIRYDLADGELATPGTLLYIKPSLSGDEPSDIANYAARHSAFPHQSTGDQWFDESQFESYRRLGQHVAAAVLDPGMPQPLRQEDEIETAVLRLREAWYPPASRVEEFSRHGEALDRLQDSMREDDNLAFLTAQLWPEWERLSEEARDPPALERWLPDTTEELDAGFNFCLSLLQLMENAYLDLNLEEDWDHPDHRGWMNLFRHWSWAPMVRVTWAIAGCTYGARFQTFCRRRLNLDLGQVVCQLRKTTARGKLTDRIKRVAKQAFDRLELNAYEQTLVGRFVDANPSQARGLSLVILQQVVKHPLGAEDAIEFTFGFALVRDSALVYFRIQDHLRRMGLARRALKELLRTGIVRTFDREAATAMVGERKIARFTHLYRSVEME